MWAWHYNAQSVIMIAPKMLSIDIIFQRGGIINREKTFAICGIRKKTSTIIHFQLGDDSNLVFIVVSFEFRMTVVTAAAIFQLHKPEKPQHYHEAIFTPNININLTSHFIFFGSATCFSC